MEMKGNGSEKEGVLTEEKTGTCCDSERKTVRSEEEKKALCSRINRIAGQIAGIKRMVEDDRYCEDILVQLVAVERAIKSLTGVVLARHMHTCILEDVKNGETDSLDGIVELFKRFQ